MKHIRGFTFVETLVSVLILSTALLGLVGLQAAGVKNVVGSHNRTQAAQLASSMADKMRANVADAGLYATSTYTTVSPASAVQTTCSPPTGCTPAQMAQNDLFDWNTQLQSSGNGLAKTGTIVATGTPVRFVITVSWSENRDDNKDGIPDPISFQTVFQL